LAKLLAPKCREKVLRIRKNDWAPLVVVCCIAEKNESIGSSGATELKIVAQTAKYHLRCTLRIGAKILYNDVDLEPSS